MTQLCQEIEEESFNYLNSFVIFFPYFPEPYISDSICGKKDRPVVLGKDKACTAAYGYYEKGDDMAANWE